MRGAEVTSRGRALPGGLRVLDLLVLAGVLLTLALGRWQLGRAAQKEDLQAALEARTQLEPLPAAALATEASAAPAQWHRRIRLQGQWVPEHTVYLDNRPMDQHPGFWVFTPLRLAGGAGPDDAVLVQRGWIPRHTQDRSVIAPYQTPTGLVSLEGRLGPLPGTRMALGEERPGPIRQNLELEALSRESGLALRPLVLVQDDGPGQPADGLRRAWSRPAADVHKHYGYAAQWFGMSALLTAWAVWVRVLRPRFRPSTGTP